MRKVIQRAEFQVGHGDVWIIPRWRKHRKSLDVNIGDVLFACNRVRADRVGKGVDDEIRIAAGFLDLTCNLGADRHGMIHHLAHLLERIEADIVQAATQILRVARQWDEVYAISFDKILEATRRGKFD